jgi:hypothetical protein
MSGITVSRFVRFNLRHFRKQKIAVSRRVTVSRFVGFTFTRLVFIYLYMILEKRRSSRRDMESAEITN